MPYPIPDPDQLSFRPTRRQLLAGVAATAGVVAMPGTAIPADDTPNEFRIWDNHCHLASFEGDTPAEKMERLIAYADRMGIERLVIYMGWPWSQDPSPEEFRRQNDQVLAAVRHAPSRALGYAYINPKHPAESVREIQRCVRDGPMVGIKLWVAHKCSHAELDPIIRLTTKLNAVVYQHTWIKTAGNLDGESTPTDLAMLAERHPEAKLLCGHAGGNWELGIRAVRARQNITLEIAGSDPTAGFVEMAVRELGAERVIYGSDTGGRSLASQLAKVYGADITDGQKNLILGGNLRRLLADILKSKGGTR